ncbi:small heat shock protein, chloroplastic-like [Rutidosis leptorrhynchoides]|uniref:small heat shock protein, chloroplastic-like n=1 Tax=Rutidosis leptorrhynchoides TaxID=125765 RepID=UPI003A9A4335
MSSLRVLRHLVTKSVISFRPASSVATSYRFLNTESIRHDFDRSLDVGNRLDLATKPSLFAGVFDRFATTRKVNRFIKRRSEIAQSAAAWIKPAITKEDDEALTYYIHMCSVKDEDVKVSVNENTVLVEAKDRVNFIKYMCWVDLPDID